MNNLIKLAEKFEKKLANDSGDSLLTAYNNVYRQHLSAAMNSIQDLSEEMAQIKHLSAAMNSIQSAADILLRLKGSCEEFKSQNTDSTIDERIIRLDNMSQALQRGIDSVLNNVSDGLQGAQDDIVYGIRPTFKAQMLKETDE